MLTYFKNNVVAFLALFVALGGTSAYAVNTINSTDIVDGQVKSVDVKDESLTTFDVSTFLGADVVDGTLTSADIQNFSLGNGDFLTGSVDSRAITNNGVSGTDMADGTITSADIADGFLRDEDIGQSAHVNFPVDIGDLPAGDCQDRQVTGLNAEGDHLLLTPRRDFGDWDDVAYTPAYTSNGNVVINACNNSTSAHHVGIIEFNLLVIDAQ